MINVEFDFYIVELHRQDRQDDDEIKQFAIKKIKEFFYILSSTDDFFVLIVNWSARDCSHRIG